MPTDGPSGAQVVAQLLAGAPVDMKLVVGVAEPWTSIAEALVSCVGTASRLSAFDRVLQGHEDADDLRRSVFAADPDATAQSASAVVTDEQPSIQMLPAEVQLNSVPRADAGNWIDIYVDHVTKIVPMTPHLFLEASALWLASVVVARRLVVPMPFAAIYPNLWIMWIATTTLYRKSTAMNIARYWAETFCPSVPRRSRDARGVVCRFSRSGADEL